jgi:hypothetical protein
MEQVTANLSGKSRRDRLQGRDFLVAPLSLLVPGVLNGSKGPLLYPPEEISKNPGAWNGVPIVVDHPAFQGQHVSARDPDVLNRQWIGYVFRSKANGKLTAEGWFDVAAVERVDNRIARLLESGKQIELSTGLFTDNEPAERGATTNDGKPYSFIARNYRPDHLAIVPDQIGACSVEDGCGVNVNADLVENLEKAMTESAEAYKQLTSNIKESDMASLSDEARKKIVEDLIANSCCWDEADREVLNELDDGKLGQLKAQAEKDQQREAVINAAKKGFEDPGGNAHTYNEKEGKWESKIKEPEPVVNKEEKDKKPLTQEEQDKQWMDKAPVSVKTSVRLSEEIINREKTALIGQLTANIEGEDKAQLQERLQAKPLDELRDLMVLAPKQEEPRAPSYAGAAAPAMNRTASDFDPDDVLPLPVMNLDEKE